MTHPHKYPSTPRWLLPKMQEPVLWRKSVSACEVVYQSLHLTVINTQMPHSKLWRLGEGQGPPRPDWEGSGRWPELVLGGVCDGEFQVRAPGRQGEGAARCPRYEPHGPSPAPPPLLLLQVPSSFSKVVKTILATWFSLWGRTGTDPDCRTWLQGTGGPDLSECVELRAQANGRVVTLLLCHRQSTLD